GGVREKHALEEIVGKTLEAVKDRLMDPGYSAAEVVPEVTRAIDRIRHKEARKRAAAIRQGGREVPLNQVSKTLSDAAKNFKATYYAQRPDYTMDTVIDVTREAMGSRTDSGNPMLSDRDKDLLVENLPDLADKGFVVTDPRN